MTDPSNESEFQALDREVAATEEWMGSKRFEGITRLYSARQIAEQRGTIRADYTVAREAADAFWAHLVGLAAQNRSITTFGPYSPGQAVMMKRMGIEGIYLGGWATSAKGSTHEDPGPDLASYPLSQVPDEAAVLVRALLAADKNQAFARARMTEEQRKATPPFDFRPFLIADADTGHGGEAHVRNLIRRFVEAGVPGYHIEDQKPGVKKCGHQAGKVLVAQDEQIRRLVAARFQLDLMQVAGIIVARTDAEAATYLDSRGDERDHPYLLGATSVGLPSYKVSSLAVLKRFHDEGISEVNGHLLYQISEDAFSSAFKWMERSGVMAVLDAQVAALKSGQEPIVDNAVDKVYTKLADVWQMEAGLKTYAHAVADVLRFHEEEGSRLEMSAQEWLDFAKGVSYPEARERAKTLGVSIIWDAEIAKTPEGYYQIQGGLDYAIARSLACAPFTDILWMETKTADLKDAREYAEAIHAKFPGKMMAYNLSPSFNWDSTGMSEDEMREFPTRLGELGFVFNFITYGGHQVDGLAAEEFATSLQQEGMLALAKIQRKMRLLDSPYKTPQTHVGGNRLDGVLMAVSGRTATTKAMGKGSTQFQHLIQTEVPAKVLEDWLAIWGAHHGVTQKLKVELRPHTPGSDVLELSILGEGRTKVANMVFAPIHDRRNRTFLSIRDQNVFTEHLRRKRLSTLLHIYVTYRYKASSVHYVTPTDDNRIQTKRMQEFGILAEVHAEVGQMIVATVDMDHVRDLAAPDHAELTKLIEHK